MAKITSIEERLIYYIIIPHMILPYKTSIDKRLVVYAITRCYHNNEYCRAFAIAAGDSIKYQGGHMMRISLPSEHFTNNVEPLRSVSGQTMSLTSSTFMK